MTNVHHHNLSNNIFQVTVLEVYDCRPYKIIYKTISFTFLIKKLVKNYKKIQNILQVTVLEVHDRRPYKIMDRRREMKKGVMAESLEELIERGRTR